MTSRARSARERLGIAGENVVGSAIRKFRLERFPQLSDREFCEALYKSRGLKIDKSTLSKIERGVRCLYDYEILEFSRFLNITLNDLFDLVW